MTATDMGRAALFVILSAMCLVGPVGCHKRPEAKADEAKVEQLLNKIPQEQFDGLQDLASRVIGGMKSQPSTEDEFEAIVLAAMRKEGLLDDWKKKLNTMVFDDSVEYEGNQEAGHSNDGVKCANKASEADAVQNDLSSPTRPASVSMEEMEKAVHQMLGNDAAAPFHGVTDDDVNYLLKSAEKLLQPQADRQQEPSPYLTVPQSAQRKPESVRVEKNQPEAARGKKSKAEPKKKAKKKQVEPLDAIVGFAKQYLGQDESDPTLDIIANMAAAYLKSEPEKPSQKKKAEKSSGLDLGSMLQLASMFTGDSAENNVLQSLSSVIGGLGGGGGGDGNGGMNFEQMIQMGSMLMGQPTTGKKSSSPVVELVIRFVANFLDMDPELFMSYYTGFQEMVDTNNWGDINNILRSTTGTDVEAFLDMLGNDDIREHLAETASVSLAAWLQAFLTPESLKTKVFYVNSFLLQYSYSPIDPKNLIETSSIVIDRVISDFLSYEVDSVVYMRQAESQLKNLLRVDESEALDFRNFTQPELSGALSHSIKLEVFDALATVWSDYKLASKYPKCARTIICSRNSPTKVRTPLGLKAAVTRASSTAVVWILSKTGSRSMPSFTELYQAAWDGAQGRDCQVLFKENCAKILEGDVPALELTFDHHEL